MSRACGFIALLVSISLVSAVAQARPRGRASTGRTSATTARPGHGQRAYQDALTFARTHNLPHFTVRNRGRQRLVVNVPENKLGQWCQTFSKGKCYIEPFFKAGTRSAPGWSYLRIGDNTWRQYGNPSTYYSGSGRVAFPVSLSNRELSACENAIRTSRNGPWRYNGGDPERTGRNCTNWVTHKIGQFTGVRTASVVHHMRSLVKGHHSDRMSVMAVMTRQPMQHFGPEVVGQLAESASRGH